jgi:hypothetical protein
MGKLHGIRSFEGLRSRATGIEFGAHKLLVARLEDILRVSVRPEGGGTWRCWTSWRGLSMNRKTAKNKQVQLAALKKESERALVEQIRRLLALPMNKRTHFLRVRHPSGGSHL